TLVLVSWGGTGHRTIGKIAEKHLNPQAKAAVRDLLGSESLADVSTYADQVRSQDAYKYTAPWHYINMPTGLSRRDFNREVISQQKDNVYCALLSCKNDLTDSTKTREQKIFALKFIVHLVGDLHQPMHVSRSEDQGGNQIMTTFLGKPGNLHGLWDSGLLEHEGLSYEQLAEKVDHASDRQIRRWQHDDPLTWLYESYRISKRLYADAAKKPDFDEAYYQAHIPVFEQRMEMAGIRLAGVLNAIYHQ
ncbi:MAG TPA: S1/P1 nuclease, partial [Puia sp.]|nr:S1/P1 nuclease [Puia sp.]